MHRVTFIALLASFSTFYFAGDRVSLRSNGNEAEAVCINNVSTINDCFILVGSQKYDISQAESANLGKFGLRERSEYSKIISIPTKWLQVTDGSYIVEITTQVWFEGEHYTVTEPALVKGGVYRQR